MLFDPSRTHLGSGESASLSVYAWYPLETCSQVLTATTTVVLTMAARLHGLSVLALLALVTVVAMKAETTRRTAFHLTAQEDVRASSRTHDQTLKSRTKRNILEYHAEMMRRASEARVEGLHARGLRRAARAYARREVQHTRRVQISSNSESEPPQEHAELGDSQGGTSEYPSSSDRLITEEELARHNSKNSAWICILGKVYDITAWLDAHPGGPSGPLSSAGTDGTSAFFAMGHDLTNLERGIRLQHVEIKGRLEGYVMPSPPSPTLLPTHDSDGIPILYPRPDLAMSELKLITRVREVLAQRRDNVTFCYAPTATATEAAIGGGFKLPPTFAIPRDEWLSHPRWSDCTQMPTLHVPLRVAVQRTIFHLASRRMDDNDYPVATAYETFKNGMRRVREHVRVEETSTFPALGRHESLSSVTYDALMAHLTSDHHALHEEEVGIERDLQHLAAQDKGAEMRRWKCVRGSERVCHDRRATIGLAEVVSMVRRVLAFDERFMRHLQEEEDVVVSLALQPSSY